MIENKRYRIHVHLRGTHDQSRDGGWWGTLEAINMKEALIAARKKVHERYIVDGAELTRPGEFMYESLVK